MKIDFNIPVLGLDDKPLLGPDQQPAVLGDLVGAALIASDDDRDAQNKYRRFKLAQKLSAGAADISVEDAALIKAVVGRLASPILVGRVFDLIENGATKATGKSVK